MVQLRWRLEACMIPSSTEYLLAYAAQHIIVPHPPSPCSTSESISDCICLTLTHSSVWTLDAKPLRGAANMCTTNMHKNCACKTHIRQYMPSSLVNTSVTRNAEQYFDNDGTATYIIQHMYASLVHGQIENLKLAW